MQLLNVQRRLGYTKKNNRRAAKNYVCPVCFRRPNKCICSCYSMSLILIDSKLQYAIQKLNDANFFTVDCCEGHFENKIPNTYISFVKNRKFVDAPKGFEIENGNVLRYTYKNTKSKTEFKKEQEEVINNLNKWVDYLTGDN